MKLYTRNELKSSRIFFDKQPPRFMTMFIMFLIVLLVTSIIAAQFVKRPYVVRAQGTVSVEGASYLSSKTQGVVTAIHVQSGQFVEKGDIILELSSGNEGLQKSVTQAQIAELEDTLLIMDKYEQALEQGENILSSKGKELEYYGKTAYYIDELNQELHENAKVRSKMIDKNKELNNIKIEVKDLETKLNSVNKQLDEQKKQLKKINYHCPRGKPNNNLY